MLVVVEIVCETILIYWRLVVDRSRFGKYSGFGGRVIEMKNSADRT